jgi:hypothetical protein
MSQWSTVPALPSIQGNDGYAHPSAPTSHSRHASNASSGASPSLQRHGSELLPPRGGLELPPLVRTSVSPSIPRSVTLPSVLNPVIDEVSTSHQRRRKADEIDSPRDGASILPPLNTMSQGSALTSRAGNSTPLPLLTEPLSDVPRRMLTPKSPLRRAISMSHLNPPNGMIDAQQNPFPVSPRSGPYAVQPGTLGAPSVAAPPAASYTHPGIAKASHLGRTASPDSDPTQRSSGSPSPDYSAYDPTSPPGDLPGYLSVSAPHRGGRSLSTTPGTSTQMPDSYHVAVSSGSGQGSLQMMTLKTSEGDVRFPVDVQAASRVADEKRRRNAGASARFRERRKRKEMEASHAITRLEQQLKDVSEDAEFYRQDRDMLASILSQLPGGREHLPRPRSPRSKRNGGGSARTNQGRYVEVLRNSPEPIRNVRKRGDSPVQSTYVQTPVQQGHAPPTSQPSASATVTQHHMQQGQIPARLVHASPLPPPHSSVHTAMIASSLPPPPPPSLMQAPPMTGPTNPYARHENTNRFQMLPHGR